MKTFKLFSMAALALMMAACSSEDNEIATAPKTQGVKFTATISTGNSGATRALSENGNTIEATWAVDETVALVYTVGETAYNTTATVTAVDGDGKATIEATLDATPTEETAVTLIYPATAADGTTGNVRSAAEQLEGQDGTLETISSKLEARKGTGTLTVNGTTATLKEAVTMENQYAIFKFTVKNSDASATINVKPLTITIGSQDYVITPASATSELYVALPAVSGQAVRFSATGSDSKTYTCSKASVNFAAGKYYQSTLKMTPLITVTWNHNDITYSGSHNSFTKDGVTITAGMIDFNEKNFMEGGTFSTTLGNFTKIEVTTGDFNASGTGWSGRMQSGTWTGTPASSVSFSGEIMGMGGMMGDTKFVFTIEPTN